ncbi:MAG TPA: glucose-1-phosphate cytidylyltransferase [Sedimenticola sp.]|nr:glucose-1-phosphate cytidylyltransferase [Sedimenticola sp.]
MKTIILAGGFGTRLAEYTDLVPKPMVTIGGRPILWHIMRRYAAFGHKDFVVALGYKAEVVKEYFLNYRALSSDFSVDLGTGAVMPLQASAVDWRVTLVDTGVRSLTGGRVKRLANHVCDGTFMLTYGDGLASIDLDRLLDFHRRHGRLVTVTAVHPAARFGELTMNGDQVVAFSEKPQVHDGWINGGFFVCEPAFLDFIAGDDTVLEQEPLERVAAAGQLVAYRHDGFWQCMDTKRDRDVLEALWESGRAPWLA